MSKNGIHKLINYHMDEEKKCADFLAEHLRELARRATERADRIEKGDYKAVGEFTCLDEKSSRYTERVNTHWKTIESLRALLGGRWGPIPAIEESE